MQLCRSDGPCSPPTPACPPPPQPYPGLAPQGGQAGLGRLAGGWQGAGRGKQGRAGSGQRLAGGWQLGSIKGYKNQECCPSSRSLQAMPAGCLPARRGRQRCLAGWQQAWGAGTKGLPAPKPPAQGAGDTLAPRCDPKG